LSDEPPKNEIALNYPNITYQLDEQLAVLRSWRQTHHGWVAQSGCSVRSHTDDKAELTIAAAVGDVQASA
jgi:hypothetical protein